MRIQFGLSIFLYGLAVLIWSVLGILSCLINGGDISECNISMIELLWLYIGCAIIAGILTTFVSSVIKEKDDNDDNDRTPSGTLGSSSTSM